VDLEAGLLRVRESLEKSRPGLTFKGPKTEKSRRTIRIPATTLALLRRHRTSQVSQRLAVGPAYRDLDLVIARSDGSPVDPAWLSKEFTKVARSAGITDIHYHCLRHTAATTMLRLNVHPKVVGEMLGHSTTALTLDTYSHVTPVLQDDAARRLDEVFSTIVKGA
jgi:integrase